MWSAFEWQQWVGIIIFICFFTSLFWCRPVYKFITRHEWVTQTVGSLYLLGYIFYHVMHSVFFAYVLPKYANYSIGGQTFSIDNYSLLHYSLGDVVPYINGKPLMGLGEVPVAPWNQFVPFHLSDIGQICGALLFITRSKHLFDVSMPIFCFMPFVSIMSPEKVFWNYDNYFFWEFYLNHSMMMIVFWWFYLYGVKDYNFHSLRWSYISLFIFALIAFGYDYGLNTNLLYVGLEGWALFQGVTTSNILTGHDTWGVSLLSMVVFGVIMLTVSYLIVILFTPLFSYDRVHRRFLKYDKTILRDRIVPFREFFIWKHYVFMKTLPGLDYHSEAFLDMDKIPTTKVTIPPKKTRA